jgi:hypothetical protein|tara:strand:- start:1142 stop:1351 length:210 start_codon:yes stop_codon:yes gene_type:complete
MNTTKKEQRELLEKQIKEFEAKGGKIKKVHTGVSGTSSYRWVKDTNLLVRDPFKPINAMKRGKERWRNR